MKRLLFILAIVLLSYFAIGKSLQFALNGDDWLALWRAIKDFTSIQSYFDIKSYSTDYSNYTFADIIMGLIHGVWTFNPFPYYFISMLLRILAAISFYLVVNTATKNKLCGVLSTVLFATMFAGIETTNWVFNMNTYLSIVLFNIFLTTYYKWSNKLFSLKTTIQIILITATFYCAPTRMHGLLFFIPLLVFFKIRKLTKQNLINSFFSITIFYFPILFIRFLTRATNDQSYFQTFSQIFNFNKNTFITFFINLGHAFIPDQLLLRYVKDNNSQALLVVVLYIFIFLFFYKLRKMYPYLSRFAFLILSIPFLFSIIPWLINPTIIMPSDHRYQTIPGAYLLVLFAIICTTLWNFKNQFIKIISLILFLSVFFLNFMTLKSYFSSLANEGRLAEDANRQFLYIKSEIQVPDKNIPLVFLFIPDNSFYLYNSIGFGFGYHMILTDPRFGMKMQQAPFATDNLKSLVNVLSSPESSELKRYGYNPVKIPIENVYIFNLQNKVLTNITPDARSELKKLVPDL